MISTVGNWLITIPLSDPWQAIVMVLEVVVFALILHMLWNLAFAARGKLSKANSRWSEMRLANASTRKQKAIKATNLSK